MAEKDTPISVDDQVLLDFVAKGGKVTDAQGNSVDKSNVHEFLGEVAGPNTEARVTPKQKELHKKALRYGMADTSKKDLAKQEKEAARVAALKEADDKRRHGKMVAAGMKAASTAKGSFVDPVIENAGGVVNSISSASTAGGVGLLLVILMFLLLVIVQVNAAGDTRLKQFWYMLNGRATLNGRVDVVKGSTVSTGDGSTSAATPVASAPATGDGGGVIDMIGYRNYTV